MKNIRAIIAFLICMCLLSSAVALVSVYRSYTAGEKYSSLKASTAESAAALRRQINELKNELASVSGSTAVYNEARADMYDSPASITAKESYVMSAYNGIIGIFDSCGTLIRTLDVPVISLASDDRAMLCEGITVESWNEILALIQDYTG